jgi:signal transduction histidine kinase/AmiR/NasT family two-component response regulator
MDHPDTQPAVLERTFWIIGLVCGVATLALGLVVIVGWHIKNVTLVQVLPGFVPMQYNTALGFIFCGAGLTALSTRHRTVAITAGLIAVTIGGLTLVEYIAGVNLGIDELFMKHDITVATSQPGRMAPNTAVCFVLVGLGLGMRPDRWNPSSRAFLAVMLASFAFGLAWVALSGYFTGLETAYGWGNLTRMAVHTAVGFIVVSSGLLLYTWSGNLRRDSRLPRWMPIPIAVIVFTATLSFWQALEAEGAAIQLRHQDVTSISNLADVLLVVGSLLALALAGATVLAQKANRSVEEVALVNETLRDEVNIRKEAEAALEAHGARLEYEVAERTRELSDAREAAETANTAKSAFLANMSHELRTPLNAVIGYSEMMAEDLEADGKPEYVDDLMKIRASGQHLLALINDILDLSKIEAGRAELHLEEFDVEGMLKEVAATVSPLAAANANQLVPDYGPGLGVMRADLTKVRQTLFNLLSNAMKFTHEGTVTLAARRVKADGNEMLQFSVTDTGIGIAAEKVSRVFDEFTQADKSTTRNYGGTGLGLTITRHFCRLMQGDVTLTSVLGEGSTFTAVLPAEVKIADDKQSVAAMVSGGTDSGLLDTSTSGKTVLIVDDDPVARDLLRRTLEGGGYSVVAADNGTAGIEKAREINPVVIILDVIMPGMDGWETLRKLKSDDELRHIPIVMSTIIGDEAMAYTLGAAHFLPKPVDRARLLELVKLDSEAGDPGLALVIEDDDVSREASRRTLESAGWEVMEA